MQANGLKSWLTFNNSLLTDSAPGNANTWTASGTPTVGPTNALNGNALQLDGSSYLKLEDIQLGGQDFTVSFWLMNAQVGEVNKARLLSVVNRETGFMMFTVRILTGTSYPRINLWGNTYAGVTQDYGIQTTVNLTAGRDYHVAVSYHHDTTPRMSIYINGSKYTLSGDYSIPAYNRAAYDVYIGAAGASGDQPFTGTMDEFALHDGAALYNSAFTPPTAASYDALDFYFDTARKVKQAALTWRYENPGRADLLTVQNGTTETNLPLNKSVTGVGFYQPDRTACFGIPATKEVWVRCDIYHKATHGSNDRIRIYDGGSNNGNNVNGWCTYADYKANYAIWHNGTAISGKYWYSLDFKGQMVLHLKSGTTDGVVETINSWSDPQKYVGDVNAGQDFTDIYIQMDGTSFLVSNVVISNVEVGLEEGWHNYTFDIQRLLNRSALLMFDLERVLSQGSITVDVDVDLSRVLLASTTNNVDVERALSYSMQLTMDTERHLSNNITVGFDTLYRVLLNSWNQHDTERRVYSSVDTEIDVQRVLIRSEVFNCDIWRRIPHKVNGNTTTLQSITISLQEQQLTDNISFVHTGDIDIMDSVDITLLDYHNKCRAEETSTRGVLQTCKCASDIDAILYQQMAYAVPESEWEWTPEYLQAIGEYNETHEEQVEKIPSAPASAHITSIAEALGKSVSLHFTDYISTMNTEVSSGTNYAGLISELFGWTSRLPQMMINCYMRGDTIYVVQRGHEQHTVTIDNLQITVHTIQKKIVRTTWGSDPWSKTEVKPFYKDWSEFDQESYNQRPYYPDEEEEEEGGGASYGDDNLVEETTVEKNGQTTVTTYKYETMPDGRKFLCEEVAVTYVNGVEIDRTTTTHKPVSDTQSHIYTTDQDGEYIGGTVSQSNHDDRVSPYQKEVGRNSSSRDRDSGQHGVLVTGQDGNKYLLYGVIHHQDKGEMMRRTINGVTLIDTSFPVDGQDKLEELTQAIMWLDRKTEETVTLDIYNYNHIIDFNDKIVWHGHTYYLQSNNVMVSETIVNKQTLTFVRWY